MPDCEFCAFCLMPKEQPVVIQCKHSFCQLCMENYCKAVTTNRRCPLCRQAFAFYESTAGILTITVLDSDDEDPDDDSSYDDDNGQPLQVNMLPAIAESPMESSESFSTADEASNWSESSNGYATPVNMFAFYESTLNITILDSDDELADHDDNEHPCESNLRPMESSDSCPSEEEDYNWSEF